MVVGRDLHLAGWLLFLSVPTALCGKWTPALSLISGLLQLIVAILLFGRVSSRVRTQSLCLSGLGLCALLVAEADGAYLLKAFTQNQAIIAMLAAVGFLRIVPLTDTDESLPIGRAALWKTLFGIHWFGAIINFSSLVLFGDRLASPGGKLHHRQGQILARGFALAALWSPFFVAMGVALSQAPGARLTPVLLWGLPFSQLLLALTAWAMTRVGNASIVDFHGYPCNLANMKGPLLLAGIVFVSHWLLPHISIVSLVTLAAPIYSLAACHGNGPAQRSLVYIRRDLPGMGPEVLLFLAAGVLGNGLAALISWGLPDLALPLAGAPAAAIGLAVIILLAAVGIHPVVGIATVAAVLSHAPIHPEVLATSFLMGWGLGVILCPISGTNLLLSGRYRAFSTGVWRSQISFVTAAYLFSCVWLFIIDSFL
jgi:hypothetical protein